MRSTFFCDLTQRRMAVYIRRFGKLLSHLQGSSSPKRKYHSTLSKIPEERRSHLGFDGNLKSRDKGYQNLNVS